ncbi:MAG: helix-turn-helix domain-containing protein [Parabacteroides sp.]|jgi:AraC family transcriptional activator of pobA|nr:helix-turn-helix domain-containing protein [Parabacteroides sp.]OJV88400.1 MAG: hypothetical protein BGO34_18845 [Bacteroidia bacterium 44-10]
MNSKRILDNEISNINSDFCFYPLIKSVSTGTILKPLEMFGLVFVSEGLLTIETNGQINELKKGTMCCSTPGSELRLFSSNRKLKGYFLTLSPIFIESLQQCGINPDKELYQGYEKYNLNNDLNLKIKQLFIIMQNEIINNKGLFRKKIIANLVSVLILHIMSEDLINNRSTLMSDSIRESTRIKNLSNNFIKLVKQYSSEYRQVSFYADKLCISPKYLYFSVKSTTGMTPNEWINRIVIHSAKKLLQKSDNTIKEVSYTLNFPNPSFFGKYFKRLVGVSPADYQRKIFFIDNQR